MSIILVVIDLILMLQGLIFWGVLRIEIVFPVLYATATCASPTSRLVLKLKLNEHARNVIDTYLRIEGQIMLHTIVLFESVLPLLVRAKGRQRTTLQVSHHILRSHHIDLIVLLYILVLSRHPEPLYRIKVATTTGHREAYLCSCLPEWQVVQRDQLLLLLLQVERNRLH